MNHARRETFTTFLLLEILQFKYGLHVSFRDFSTSSKEILLSCERYGEIPYIVTEIELFP